MRWNGWATLPLMAALLFTGSVSVADKIPVELETVLHQATSFELYSLDPSLCEKEAGKRKESSGAFFHGVKALGKAKIRDKKVRERLIAALKKGAEDGASAVACFEPRHGIRLRYQGKTTDFVICFACRQVEVYRGDVRLTSFLITGSPLEEFDSALRSAKVPLAGRPKKGS